tara:strand:- start:8601 stop:9632 length:1032 start_codon:yes stop_codon:yes gene_type:complete
LKVLVLGGKRFMGRALVQRLLKEGHRVSILSRGLSFNPFEGHVDNINCDRFNSLEFRNEIFKLRNKSKNNIVFDAVVDFLSFTKEHARDAVFAFSDPLSIGHFVHISTGSVYAVTKRLHNNFIKEDDFSNPLNEPWENNIESWNYGTGKRDAENILKNASNDINFPETRIRIPIVEGPHDYTLRSWKYQLWLESGRAVDLPDGGRFRFTHVFSEDVIDGIMSVLNLNQEVFGEAFNLAQEESPTLKEYLLEMARTLGIKPKFKNVSLKKYWSPLQKNKNFTKSREWQPYASWLQRDSCLDISKAKKKLLWKPTSMKEALQKTCNWFNSEENLFKKPNNKPWDI